MAFIIWLLIQDGKSTYTHLWSRRRPQRPKGHQPGHATWYWNQTCLPYQQLALALFLDTWHYFGLMVKACHNMACRHHGAADDYLCLHAQTHCLMKYYIQHKFEVSNNYNTFKHHPWHGTGQGAADAALHCPLGHPHQCIPCSDSAKYYSQPTLTLTITKIIKAFLDNVAMLACTPLTKINVLIQFVQA